MACSSNLLVVDGVKAGIGANQVEHLGVVVADGANVELLCPTCLAVHDRLVVEEGAAELVKFLL